MLKLMQEREQVNVVCDQIGSPTWAGSAAQAIWGLIEASVEGGVYHWTDLGVASWYDFAVAIQEEALERGLLSRTARVVPISSESYADSRQAPGLQCVGHNHHPDFAQNARPSLAAQPKDDAR